jgi:hypothetical protein
MRNLFPRRPKLVQRLTLTAAAGLALAFPTASATAALNVAKADLTADVVSDAEVNVSAPTPITDHHEDHRRNDNGETALSAQASSQADSTDRSVPAESAASSGNATTSYNGAGESVTLNGAATVTSELPPSFDATDGATSTSVADLRFDLGNPESITLSYDGALSSSDPSEVMLQFTLTGSDGTPLFSANPDGLLVPVNGSQTLALGSGQYELRLVAQASAGSGDSASANYQMTVSPAATAAVPLPAAVWTGATMIGAFAVRVRRMSKARRRN